MQLGQQIKAWQRRAEALPQRLAEAALDEIGTGQQAKPKPEHGQLRVGVWCAHGAEFNAGLHVAQTRDRGG